MAHDRTSGTSVPTPRYRNVSGKPLNRRVVLRAAAGLSAMALGGAAMSVATPRSQAVSAQEIDGTRGREWAAEEHVGLTVEPDGDGWITFQAEFAFWAVGAGWSGDVGLWPIVEVQISYDGIEWSDIWNMTARVDDGGRESVDGRLFTDLLFADGQEFIRYRTVDNQANLAPVAGLVFSYIDPTDGPWSEDRPETMTVSSMTVANEDTDAPPSIITRAQWGANENYRYDSFGEIWPPEYQTVEHAIVHHAAVNYGSDGYNAVRSIYYYHCVTQGWGDIGYNYLVDPTGKIFQGRVGGQNVIGGHAYEYAIGSSGICVIGDFRYQDATNAAKAALVHILAFVTRDLDTYATKPFHEVPALPTICAHRDVNQTSCPGDFLYADLPEIRDLVAATLDAGTLDTGNPAGIVPGDRVKVHTDDGAPLNMRSGAGMNNPINGTIPDGTFLRILDGPISDPSYNWYKVRYNNVDGWVAADFLIVTPPPPPVVSDEDYPFGLNMRFTSSTNVRTKPTTSSTSLGQATRNTWTFIMAGPVTAENHDWYQVRVPGIGDGWVIKDNIAPAPVDENPAAKFRVGDTVSAIRSTSVRARPGIAQTVASTASTGTKMEISVKPLAVTGYIWYGVYSPTFGGGWVVENDLQGSTPPPSGGLAAGDTVRVTETLNMRTGPSTSNAIIATLPAGTTGKVLAGPATGSGYTWYQIQTSYGSGWVVQNWITKVTTTTPTEFKTGDSIAIATETPLYEGSGTNYPVVANLPVDTRGYITGGYRLVGSEKWWRILVDAGAGWVPERTLKIASSVQTGDAFEAIQSVNVREDSGEQYPVVVVLPLGKRGVVTGGYRLVSGMRWWRVLTDIGAGWVQERYIRTAPAVAVGDAFITVRTAEVHQDSASSSQVVGTLAVGTRGVVTGGYRLVDGDRWWQIESPAGNGWVTENRIQMAPPFALGDTFEVNEEVNLRSGSGTSYGIIAVLQPGTRGTITGGYRLVEGMRWWRVSTSSGDGWLQERYIRKV